MKQLFAMIVILSSFSDGHAAAPVTAKFRAGAATSVITPDLGLDIVGGFQLFPGTYVHDDLHARCLVLDDGKTKIALVVCDLLGIHRSVSIEARRLIQERTDISPDHVLISATHTHSAASALGDAGYRSEQQLDDYQKFVARRIADGVSMAVKVLRPAEVAFGSAEAHEHLFNRRWRMRESATVVNPFGKHERVKMNPPPGSPDLVEPAGPIDPTLSFVAVREPKGRLISVYSAYSLHYVGGVGGGHISADYFAIYCNTLKTLLASASIDPPFVALMANGTSGDINNINFRNPRPGKPPYEQMRIVANDLAAKVNEALAKVTWKEEAPLGALYQELDIPWRHVDGELLTWAKSTEAKSKQSIAKDVVALSYAGRVQRLANAESPARVPVQVLRIGDICIGSSPCETFAETGLEFKKRSPMAQSFMVGLGHAYLGYLPTPRHFDLGGYETWPGTNYLEPLASVKIVDALVKMAVQLAPKSQ